MTGETKNIGSMERYDASMDFTIYNELFEQYCDANAIEPTKKVAVLISYLSMETYKTIRDRCFPDMPKDKSYEDLVQLLKEQYSIPINVFRERITFYKATQNTDETCLDWYTRLKRLSINCAFKSLQEVLVDRFISGMRQGAVLDRLVEEDATKKIEDLVKIAITKETAMANSYKGNENGGNIHVIKEQQRGQSSESQPEKQGPSRAWTVNKNHRQNKTSMKTQERQCGRCGKNHGGLCKYMKYRCNNCGKIGHLKSMCRTRGKAVNYMNLCEENEQVSNQYQGGDVINTIDCINSVGIKPIKIVVKVNDQLVTMELDSGSPVSAINRVFYDQYLSNVTMKSCSTNFRGYTGELITTIGIVNVKVNYNKMSHYLDFYVISNGTVNILGRDFIDKFNLIENFVGVNKLGEADVAEVLRQEFPEVCTDEIGKFRYATVSLQLKTHVIPVHQRPKSIPLALKDKIEAELQRLEQKDIISPIVTSEWSSYIVPVVKQNGNVRICGSYIGLNKCLEDVYYPLPKIEQIFASLHDNVKFSKIDLKDAYRQFELDEKSKHLVTISTHKGLYKMNRMPFGIKCASFYCQKHIEQIFQGVDNVFVFQDDILVGHRANENHMLILRKVFQILSDAGLTVNLDKCKFSQDRISYLGFDLTAAGLTKNKDKVKAISNAPQPKNITQLRSFIGMVGYYSKFVPNITDILSPMYKLLQSNVRFQWSEACENAFSKIKEVILSDNVLMYFNPELPIIVTCDASETGIAAILSHNVNGVERTVACVSRTYSNAERHYSTVHKEALACYFGINKFEQYLYGKKFTLKTDQRSLISIFGKKTDINPMYANRIKRYALYFSNFNFEIEHISGKSNSVADCLSRLPLNLKVDSSEDNDMENILFASLDSPVDNKTIVEATNNDRLLSQVKYFILNDWPKKVEGELRPYFCRKLELDIINECVYYGHRVVIPTLLQQTVLKELHSSHEGIVRTKALARSYLWFPKIDKEIENMCKSCNHCLITRSSPPKSVAPWPKCSEPFTTIHIDHFNLRDHNFLVIIDYYSKWIDAYLVKNLSSETTIEKLRECFARFGLPVTIVSDNGTSLVSDEIEHFFHNNGIKHVKTPP